MSRPFTRRETLRIAGAAIALPGAVLGLQSLKGAPSPVSWKGEVLGGLSAMTLWHPSPEVARRAIRQMLVEVERLEGVFSLHRASSEITELNRVGALARPSRDLVEVIDQALFVAEASGGAFDPTIQPLWRLHAMGLASDRAARRRAVSRVDFTALSSAPREVRLGRPGMEISLNGIAQGHITDRITELLGNAGFETAVIELGETRALGSAPDGQPFPVALVRPGAPAWVDATVPLANAALSVSGGYGTTFAAPGGHHIFDPRTGHSADGLAQVAVVSSRAVWADALSTAICVSGEAAAGQLLSVHPGSRAILTRADGSILQV